MKIRKHLSLAALVLISMLITGWGCGPSSSHHFLTRMADPYQAEKDWPVGPTYNTPRGHLVWIASSIAVDPIRVTRILKGVDYTSDFWEEHEGIKVPPHNIGIQDHYGFNVRGYEAPNIAGGWVGDYTVEVDVGPDDDLWGLYHEFCHSVYGIYGHTDPRWLWFWYPNTDLCAYNIAQINKGLASWP